MNNERILESYKETFEEAVSVENWAMARAVIEDLTQEGFGEAAAVLEEELTKVQNEEPPIL